jgi:hypothetical protein
MEYGGTVKIQFFQGQHAGTLKTEKVDCPFQYFSWKNKIQNDQQKQKEDQTSENVWRNFKHRKKDFSASISSVALKVQK